MGKNNTTETIGRQYAFTLLGRSCYSLFSKEIWTLWFSIDGMRVIPDSFLFLWCQLVSSLFPAQDQDQNRVNVKPDVEEVRKIGVRYVVIVWRIGEPDICCFIWDW